MPGDGSVGAQVCRVGAEIGADLRSHCAVGQLHPQVSQGTSEALHVDFPQPNRPTLHPTLVHLAHAKRRKQVGDLHKEQKESST